MARKKAFIGAAISLGTSIVGGLMSSAAKRRQQEEQQRQQEAVYRAKEGSNMASSYNQQHTNDYDLSLENRRLYTSSLFKKGGEIYIKPSKRGTFTEAAKKRGQSVQGFASKVLANKDNYSSAMVKKANFARNAAKWKHLLGGVNNLFKYGGSSRFSKRATKQNLGLENVNKVGQNAPTAYRKPSVRSSISSLTSLRSTDKVVQKALDSIISSSPVKEQEDARTSYRTGGEVKQRQLGDSPYDDPTFAFTRKRFDIRKNAHGAKSFNVSIKGFRTIKALSKTLRSTSPVLEFLQNTIPSKESEYAEEVRKYSSDVAKGKDKKLEENKYMKIGGKVESDTTNRISKPTIIDKGDNRYNKRADTERQHAFDYALDKVRGNKSPNDFIYPGYSIKAINQLDSITGHPRTKITNLKSRGNRLREHYDPITNTIYRQPGLYHRVSPAEYSHAYRNSKNNEFVSAIKDYVKHPYITPEGYNKLYNTKGTYEYDAHKVVEPVLRDFLKGKFPVDSLDIKINEKRKQLKNGGTTSINPIIQEGGDAIKLKPNTFLLRGRKHRNGGIVIGKGNNSIEAEGGEVVKIDNNVMKILSTVPMTNGESPASRVIKGENPDKVFDSQEKFKDMNNLSNKKYKCGGKVQRRKAALGDWLNVAGDAFSMISPLIGGRRTKRAINRMIAPSQSQQLQTANLKTTYNISPQLTESRQAEREAIAETSANTASSVAAQARNMRIRNLSLGQRNQLLGQKENIETQLMNQAALNRQQVTNQNISATNDWRDRVGQFVNDQIVSSANVDNQMIEGVTSGIRDIQSRFDKNKQERNALTAIMASNPEQVELFMKKRKEYENLLDRNSGSLLRPYYLGGLKNKHKSKVR